MSTRDLVEPDATHDEHYHLLRTWAEDFDFGCMFLSYHRLQLEHFLVSELTRRRPYAVADIAQYEAPRVWFKDRGLCAEYSVLGLTKECDFHLDLLLDPPAALRSRFDCVICTEVLEHVKDPFRAARSMVAILKPGGFLLGSTPFCWADHRTADYDDYWRFTEQGLELLFSKFEDISIRRIQWTNEGVQLYDLMRRFEGFGVRAETYMCTGFLFIARKDSSE